MKKTISIISSIIICCMALIMPLVFTGCFWDNNDKVTEDDTPKVEYTCSSVSQTKIEDEDDGYKYTFKVEIKNNKEEDETVSLGTFGVKLEMHFYDSYSFSQGYDYVDASIKVYSDEEKENEIVSSISVSGGETKTIYVETEVLHTNYSNYGFYNSAVLTYVE